MKITTNSFGNYNPYQINKTKPAQKPQNVLPKQNVKQDDKITNEEKNFFSKLYPNKEKNIIDYHFYQSSGKMDGVAVGSLFDRRG